MGTLRWCSDGLRSRMFRALRLLLIGEREVRCYGG